MYAVVPKGTARPAISHFTTFCDKLGRSLSPRLVSDTFSAVLGERRASMHLQELSNHIEIDMDEALEERFMDSEELYVRFLKKLEAANELAVVAGLVEQQNWPEALRKAHNLKGVCGSLGV